jgi:hypothetical protein
MVSFGQSAPFNGKYTEILKGAIVRRGILSLQAAATISNVRPQAARRAKAFAAAAGAGRGELPLAAISAAPYGLKKAALRVHTAEEPKQFAVTSASLTLGPVEPRSAQNAAESYTEDLFQRGHVAVGDHADPEAGYHHPFSFKTHKIFEKSGELVLKRISFDCGFDHPYPAA